MKNLFVSKEAIANQSSEVNANEHLENEIQCITNNLSEERRTLNRWSIKKVFFAIGIIMFIGAGVFYACKKDGNCRTSSVHFGLSLHDKPCN
jgi:hypothetical protein